MAEMERFYREARMLAASANTLTEEYSANRRVTDVFCSKYQALMAKEDALVQEMRDSGVNPDASPEIQGRLERLSALRGLMGPGFGETVRRVCGG